MLFVGVPAYDGKLQVETVRALLNEQRVADGLGLEIRVGFLPGCSLITHARNQLCADFLDTEAEKLVFLDADVSFEPGSLIKLASHDVDVVGGAYRYKEAEERYPVIWLDKPELHAINGLLEVGSLPGGFLCVSRRALERLREAMPRKYVFGDRVFDGFFHAPIQEGLLFGEDAAFCTDWRAIGGQVWLDPELSLSHHGGVNSYPGHIGNWLKGR